jgi:hypothetical protein
MDSRRLVKIDHTVECVAGVGVDYLHFTSDRFGEELLRPALLTGPATTNMPVLLHTFSLSMFFLGRLIPSNKAMPAAMAILP